MMEDAVEEDAVLCGHAALVAAVRVATATPTGLSTSMYRLLRDALDGVTHAAYCYSTSRPGNGCDCGAETSVDLTRPHREHGRCPLGDECPCWQEGWRQSIDEVGGPVLAILRDAADHCNTDPRERWVEEFREFEARKLGHARTAQR